MNLSSGRVMCNCADVYDGRLDICRKSRHALHVRPCKWQRKSCATNVLHAVSFSTNAGSQNVSAICSHTWMFRLGFEGLSVMAQFPGHSDRTIYRALIVFNGEI
ncbi:hypothetical protein TNCV_3327841 [Trichonephila clavipes]|nr:hypothetical protein TNCV_3327841 [Trichonephila clavipes]